MEELKVDVWDWVVLKTGEVIQINGDDMNGLTYEMIERHATRFEIIRAGGTTKRIYLAGPDVFRFNALGYFEAVKKLCKSYGFEGLSPFDNDSFNGELFSKEHSTNIFKGNFSLIDKCDIIMANLIPFRGACVDDGTAWELGYGYSKGKLLYGYTPMIVKLPYQLDMDKYPDSLLEFPIVESFGDNLVNLMIQESIELSGGKILNTLENCLKDLK
jgi:nucleoside 2-deoxyribosyltransferase